MVLPCTQVPENLRFDVYSGPDHHFAGTVKHRLNVVSDPKRARELMKVEAPPKQKAVEPPVESLADAVVDRAPYRVEPHDPRPGVVMKFLAYMSLGPTSKEDVATALGTDVSDLVDTYTQPYDPHDTFIADDKFFREARSSGLVLLKDKAYKDFHPWLWLAYTASQRSLVLLNINNALTRLGYSETHPLRRKIVSEPHESLLDSTPASLGGGLLTRRTPTPKPKASSPAAPAASKSPAPKTAPRPSQAKPRALTESPKVLPEKKKPNLPKKPMVPSRELPLKKRKFLASSSSSSSDDDDDARKRQKKDGDDDSTSPLSLNDDTYDEKPKLDKKLQYYNNLAVKFRSTYKEYQALYNSLEGKKTPDKKKQLIKLFELHTKLSEWKRTLWDYFNEHNFKESIMHLSKHKKVGPAATPGSTLSAPSPSSVPRIPRPKPVSMDY